MDFIPCTLKQLPPYLWQDAARTAVVENPANKPGLPPVASLLDLQPQHLALLVSKYWGAGGVHLSVSFLDDPPTSVRSRILSHANAWSEFANVKFSEVSSGGQVRVARTPGHGYYSYLGTDILHIPAGQQTLNLDSFTDSTPESEYRRVVRHEFGHTLGFPHEHMRRELVQRIDPQKAIVYFWRTQGWSAQDVQQQVLTPLDESLLRATEHADQTSIMCYQLPGSITTDGQPIAGGTDIDVQDQGLVGKVYPMIVPPSPPPPPPPPTVSGIITVLRGFDALGGLVSTFKAG